MCIEFCFLFEILFDFGDFLLLLVCLYVVCGVCCVEELDKGLVWLIFYQWLKGIEEGVVLLVDVLEGGQWIFIVGDFDVDGVIVSSVGVLVLCMFGVVWVDYLVLNCFEYGYGLILEIVGVVLEKCFDLLVMVDNGIFSVDGVQVVKVVGFKVLVIDYYLFGLELLVVDVIINFNQLGCEFFSKVMVGVGVIFYVMLVLWVCLCELDWFVWCGLKELNFVELFDLVVLGSVVDVVLFDVNNCILVYQGFVCICVGCVWLGLCVLLEVVGWFLVWIIFIDLGFIFGLCLNVVGWFDDMFFGIECLFCDDEVLVCDMVVQFDQLNQDCKVIEQGMQCEVLVQFKELSLE